MKCENHQGQLQLPVLINVHHLKSKLINFLKRHPVADKLVWRLKHPCRGDQIDALEAAVNRCEAGIDRLVQCQETLARVVFRDKAQWKSHAGMPIKVLFVCHDPALWSMHETIYKAMVHNANFDPMVVAMPYANRGGGEDAAMSEYCLQHGMTFVSGYDDRSTAWLDPVRLSPDYVFFQTPYRLFPSNWCPEAISMHATICYVPYGTTIFRGEVYDIVHPQAFFRYAGLIFKENSAAKLQFESHFSGEKWYDPSRVIVTGTPKLDHINSARRKRMEHSGNAQHNQDVRILWTPRWRTEEGACGFFDYHNYFIQYCINHSNVRFVMRLHPLCRNNFGKTGEFSNHDFDQMKKAYSQVGNMTIDETHDYQAAMESSDILISDISSCIWEYMPTGKPIVYTHKTDLFNEIGATLARGCYWVHDTDEMDATLERLIRREDPLLDAREGIIGEHYYLPEHGAGNAVSAEIERHYDRLSRQPSGMHTFS